MHITRKQDENKNELRAERWQTEITHGYTPHRPPRTHRLALSLLLPSSETQYIAIQFSADVQPAGTCSRPAVLRFSFVLVAHCSFCTFLNPSFFWKLLTVRHMETLPHSYYPPIGPCLRLFSRLCMVCHTKCPIGWCVLLSIEKNRQKTELKSD